MTAAAASEPTIVISARRRLNAGPPVAPPGISDTGGIGARRASSPGGSVSS